MDKSLVIIHALVICNQQVLFGNGITWHGNGITSVTIVVIQQENTNLNFCLLVCQFTENNTFIFWCHFMYNIHCFELCISTYCAHSSSTILDHLSIWGSGSTLTRSLSTESMSPMSGHTYLPKPTVFVVLGFQNKPDKVPSLQWPEYLTTNYSLEVLVDKATGSSSRLTDPFCAIQICVLLTTLINSIVTFTVTSPLK